jgi:hypothetical protein
MQDRLYLNTLVLVNNQLDAQFFLHICFIYILYIFRASTCPFSGELIVFDVRKSVHHHTIQIIQPTSCNSFTSLLLDVYVWLNMFWVSPRPSSGAYNCTRSLWFYRWREAAGVLLVVVWQVWQTTTDNTPDASLQR